MNRDLTLALCDLQLAVQTATTAAKQAGDEATYHELRKLAWSTTMLLTSVARDQAAEVIKLDDKSADAFEVELANPSEPTPALVDLFRKGAKS